MSGILKNVRINENFSFRDFFYYIAGKSQKNSLNAPFHLSKSDVMTLEKDKNGLLKVTKISFI